MKQDVQFLFTINGLPSLGLGAYLAEFGKRSTQLQMAFSEITRGIARSDRLSWGRAAGRNSSRPPDLAYWGIATLERTPLSDEDAMALALAEARAAAEKGEVPVGAVALVGGIVVAARHNEREGAADPTAHAEILALRDAATGVGGWRLSDLTLVVTLEPCPMCAGALVAARVRRVVFGATDPRAGACGTLYNLCTDPRLNHELEVMGGVEAAACAALLSSFFAGKRTVGDEGAAPSASGDVA